MAAGSLAHGHRSLQCHLHISAEQKAELEPKLEEEYFQGPPLVVYAS